MRVSADGGGAPTVLLDSTAMTMDISADSREVLAFRSDAASSQPIEIPLAGGPARPVDALPKSTILAAYAPGGRGYTYLIPHEGGQELFNVPSGGGAAKRIARVEDWYVRTFAWSPDGQRLAVVKETSRGDVVLFKRQDGTKTP
jgi:hypothetical protein